MIRKMLVVAAAVAMPASALAVGAIGGGVASATATPPTPIVCAASGTVTFAGPNGLTHDGTVTTAKTSTTNTSTTSFDGPSCGTGGSTPGKAITSKNSKCSGTNTGTPATVVVPGCVKKSYYYGTAASFVGTGAANLKKALKSVTLTVNGITFAGKTSTTSSIAPGGACGSEAGFLVSGKVKATGQAYKTFQLRACLGADTGPNTTGDFFTDFATELGGNTTIGIQTAAIDHATSQLTIS
jgi:hypothetical protein